LDKETEANELDKETETNELDKSDELVVQQDEHITYPSETQDITWEDGDEDLDDYDFIEYVINVITTPINYHVKCLINKLKEKNPEHDLITLGLKTRALNFSIDTHAKLETFSEGYQSTKKYFENK